jgi:hypothetical protein
MGEVCASWRTGVGAVIPQVVGKIEEEYCGKSVVADCVRTEQRIDFAVSLPDRSDVIAAGERRKESSCRCMAPDALSSSAQIARYLVTKLLSYESLTRKATKPDK